MDAVCADKVSGDFVTLAIHEFEGHQTHTDKPGHNFTLNALFDLISLQDYDGQVKSGWRAPGYLRFDSRVIETVEHFFTTNKPVAAICHGAQVLVAANVLKGRQCSAYPAGGSQITAADENYKTVEMTEAIPGHNTCLAGKSGLDGQVRVTALSL